MGNFLVFMLRCWTVTGDEMCRHQVGGGAHLPCRMLLLFSLKLHPTLPFQPAGRSVFFFVPEISVGNNLHLDLISAEQKQKQSPGLRLLNLTICAGEFCPVLSAAADALNGSVMYQP